MGQKRKIQFKLNSNQKIKYSTGSRSTRRDKTPTFQIPSQPSTNLFKPIIKLTTAVFDTMKRHEILRISVHSWSTTRLQKEKKKRRKKGNHAYKYLEQVRIRNSRVPTVLDRNPPQRILHNRVQQVRFLHTNPFDEHTRWAREVSLARNAPRRQLFSVA